MCNPGSHPHPCDRDLELGRGGPASPPSDVEVVRPLVPSSKRRRPRAAQSNDDDNGPPSAPASSGGGTDAGFGSKVLDGLPPSQQMALLGFLMFLFFGMHNVLQEAIVNLLSNRKDSDGGARAHGDSTLMLGYAEVVGVTLFSYLERTYATSEGGWERKAPLKSYPLLTACLFASSSLSNLSLGYINFPTKVVFRSCKLVPTMIIATVVNKRAFASYEYLCALSICAGLVLFALADYALDPLKYSPVGLALVSGSVVADAILPNAQERLFAAGSSRLEVTVYSNLFSLVGMTVVTLGNGTLFPFVRLIGIDSTLASYFAVYTVLSYVSISCYMTLVKRFGGVAAVVLTTARKGMTLALSFLLFPKGFSWMYVHGSLLVLGAVMVAGICKKMTMRSKEGAKAPSSPEPPRERTGGARTKGAGRGSGSKNGRSSDDATVEDADSESSPEVILERISKRAYV
ncbi:hypothetical protein ACHAWF_012707 [Thalassiosira exigua]